MIDPLDFNVQARRCAQQVGILGAPFGTRRLCLQTERGGPETGAFVGGKVLAVDDESCQPALVCHVLLRSSRGTRQGSAVHSAYVFTFVTFLTLPDCGLAV